MNIVESFESITKIMKTCIEKELTDDGLLHDVNTFISVRNHENVLDEPVVWMYEHTTTAEKQTDLSQTMTLITPFEFDCAVYKTDMEEATEASENLTSRVIIAISKNYQHVQSELYGKRVIKDIRFDRYEPAGEVPIVGKSERVIASGVILNVIHPVNWVRCCKKD